VKGNDMQTQTTENPNAPIAPTADDVVRRGIKRILPCKLTESEFMEVAKKRVAREALLIQCAADLQRETKKRKDQIAELEEEIAKMGRELHTESEDRTVLCNDVFRRGEDGTGYVHTIRLDTNEEVEKRPATPGETQRYLPTLDATPSGSVLDQARSAQSTAPANGTNGNAEEPDVIKPEDLDDDEDEDTDDEASDKPKRRGKGKKPS
jgi:hypothetical protein